MPQQKLGTALVELTPENKAHIDALTLIQLEHRWRYATEGDAWLDGETGVYWGRRMYQLRHGIIEDNRRSSVDRRRGNVG